MVGYQEILSDPSYADQGVIMTYPLIGNYGTCKNFNQSFKSFVSGLVIGELCDNGSSSSMEKSLIDYLSMERIPCLFDVDTRAVTRKIRSAGTMKGVIVSEYTSQATIDEMMEETAGNTRLTLILFLSYSGKWDILQAAKKLALKYRDRADELPEASAEEFGDLLVTAGIPDPDLLIRTSGEERISNYLLWQTAYSEFYFTDILWPDFRKEAFRAALDEYARRDRRYGKVK